MFVLVQHGMQAARFQMESEGCAVVKINYKVVTARLRVLAADGLRPGKRWPILF